MIKSFSFENKEYLYHSWQDPKNFQKELIFLKDYDESFLVVFSDNPKQVIFTIIIYKLPPDTVYTVSMYTAESKDSRFAAVDTELNKAFYKVLSSNNKYIGDKSVPEIERFVESLLVNLEKLIIFI